MNPYMDTEWESTWQDGYDAGLAAPQAEITAPTPMGVDVAQVYMEGVLAGQKDGNVDGSPVAIDPPTEEEPHSAVHTVTTTLGIGMLVLEIAHLSPIGVAIELIVLSVELESFPPDLSDPDQLSSALVAACRAKGATELFMPFCQTTDHSETGDKVFEAGLWHGDMFTDFFAAQNAAVAHLSGETDSLGRVGVIRVRAETSAIVEWIVLN